MTQRKGLQIFDAAGNCVVDTSVSFTQVLGEQMMSTATGHIDVQCPDGARIWFYQFDTASGNKTSDYSLPVKITVNGKGIDWAYQIDQATVYGMDRPEWATTAHKRVVVYGIY